MCLLLPSSVRWVNSLMSLKSKLKTRLFDEFTYPLESASVFPELLDFNPVSSVDYDLLLRFYLKRSLIDDVLDIMVMA